MPTPHRPILSSPDALKLQDEGIVEFAYEDLGQFPCLKHVLNTYWKAENQTTSSRNQIQYKNSSDLLLLLHCLQTELRQEEAEQIRFHIHHENETAHWSPLASLFETIGDRGVSEYILHHYFTTYMQPIVGPAGQIVGYECLLRPLPEQNPFRPAELFEKARKIGQHTFLDREARHAAIRISSAHLPQGIKRFVNFLPSSLYCADTCLQGTFEAIRETGTDPEDVVFEVAETEPLDTPEMANIFEHYRRHGVRMAVDDVGSGYATVASIEHLKPDYVKLDRRWISYCDQDSGKQRHIEDVLERTSRFHGVVLAEGVEREEEWQFLRQIGVPLLQGYLFGKAAPIPTGLLPAVSTS